jgi:hypothetical protein
MSSSLVFIVNDQKKRFRGKSKQWRLPPPIIRNYFKHVLLVTFYEDDILPLKLLSFFKFLILFPAVLVREKTNKYFDLETEQRPYLIRLETRQI